MPLRRFTTAELVLTQRLQLERPLLLLVLLGAVALALAEGNAFYLTLTIAGVLANALALERRLEVYVPRLAVNLAVIAATVFFLLDFLGPSDVLPALGHYLVLIQLCKLFEQKRNRDYAQMIALSVVLIVASAMVTTAVWFVVVLLVYVPVAFYVAMVLTLKVALDRQASARLSAEAGPIDPRRLAWQVSGVFPRRALWRLALVSAGLAGAGAVAVFLLMPRGQAGILSPVRISAVRPSLTGFAGNISLRDVGRITEDPRVVMQVEVECDGQPPVAAPLYLRGRAYDEYAGGEWRAWRGGIGWWSGQIPASEPPPSGGKVITQTVTMDPGLLPALFAVAPVLKVDGQAGLTVTGSYPELQAERFDLGSDGPVRYTAHSWAQPLDERQRAFLAGVRRHVPGDAEEPIPRGGRQAIPRQVAELARAWCKDLLDESEPPPDPGAPEPADPPPRRSPRRAGVVPLWQRTVRGLVSTAGATVLAARSGATRSDGRDLAIARRIADRLQSQYEYTLDLSGVDPDVDPVVDFLTRTRRGHCEYFASAMTLLCRSLGVNARLAAGFVAAEPGGPAGGYLVRARDAHAWCEVYTPSTDWVTFDPTPPGAIGRQTNPVRRFWDALKFLWSTRVIGYGEDDRQSLVGGFQRLLRWLWRGAVRFFTDAARGLWNLLAHGRVDAGLLAGVALVAGGGVLAAAVLAGVLWRRRRRGGQRTAPVPPAFYRRLLAVLRRRGLKPLPHQTPREFLRRAEAALGFPPAELTQMADLLYQIRWGGTAPAGALLRRAEDMVENVRARLR